MKTIKSITIIALALVVLASCSGSKSTQIPGITKEFSDSVSYAVGASVGSMIKQAEFGQLNMKEVHKAIDDVLADKTLKVDMNLANDIITRYLIKKQEAASIENTEKGLKFLEENKGKEGVITLESGLQYKILAEGNGVTPAAEDTVEV
ncbi:MAG: FKBP-type peptidyl-prolyl cis-trans isomerase N-terminal domain-containing protein, partial [Bacteroidales bacterium]|nr:FKBP-type peptidyl-prolyl cis-trans isomerase N-terminal domain-containing protein [Bacteroidales bacterium]